MQILNRLWSQSIPDFHARLRWPLWWAVEAHCIANASRWVELAARDKAGRAIRPESSFRYSHVASPPKRDGRRRRGRRHSVIRSTGTADGVLTGDRSGACRARSNASHAHAGGSLHGICCEVLSSVQSSRPRLRSRGHWLSQSSLWRKDAIKSSPRESRASHRSRRRCERNRRARRRSVVA